MLPNPLTERLIALANSADVLALVREAVAAFDIEDAERVQACVGCGLVFWQARRDSKTCSPSCQNRLGVTRHRHKSIEACSAYESRRLESQQRKLFKTFMAEFNAALAAARALDHEHRD